MDSQIDISFPFKTSFGRDLKELKRFFSIQLKLKFNYKVFPTNNLDFPSFYKFILLLSFLLLKYLNQFFKKTISNFLHSFYC